MSHCIILKGVFKSDKQLPIELIKLYIEENFVYETEWQFKEYEIIGDYELIGEYDDEECDCEYIRVIYEIIENILKLKNITINGEVVFEDEKGNPINCVQYGRILINNNKMFLLTGINALTNDFSKQIVISEYYKQQRIRNLEYVLKNNIWGRFYKSFQAQMVIIRIILEMTGNLNEEMLKHYTPKFKLNYRNEQDAKIETMIKELNIDKMTQERIIKKKIETEIPFPHYGGMTGGPWYLKSKKYNFYRNYGEKRYEDIKEMCRKRKIKRLSGIYIDDLVNLIYEYF